MYLKRLQQGIPYGPKRTAKYRYSKTISRNSVFFGTAGNVSTPHQKSGEEPLHANLLSEKVLGGLVLILLHNTSKNFRLLVTAELSFCG